MLAYFEHNRYLKALHNMHAINPCFVKYINHRKDKNTQQNSWCLMDDKDKTRCREPHSLEPQKAHPTPGFDGIVLASSFASE